MLFSIRSEGLVTRYIIDREFVTWIKMLPSLAFVPEMKLLIVSICSSRISQNLQSMLQHILKTIILGKIDRTLIYHIRIWNGIRTNNYMDK